MEIQERKQSKQLCLADCCQVSTSGVFQSPLDLRRKDAVHGHIHKRSECKEQSIAAGTRVEAMDFDAETKQWPCAPSVLQHNESTFELQQMHAHSPSEHHLHGKSYAAEIHLVYQDHQGHLLVLALPVKIADRTSQWVKRMLSKKGFRSKLHGFKKYFTYPGSLTAPPLDRNVNWIVRTHACRITREDFDEFEWLCRESRPLQDRAGRVIAYLS